jgi:hypothetical protein
MEESKYWDTGNIILLTVADDSKLYSVIRIFLVSIFILITTIIGDEKCIENYSR